jgi:CRP-like cAMP-binding protein
MYEQQRHLRHVSQTEPGIFQTILTDPALEARRISLNAGTVIYEPDAPAEHVHLIHRGQVRLYQTGENGASRLCDILGADEWFGVGAMARAETHGVRAVAVVPTVVTEVRADRLLEVMASRPESLVELNRQLALRLRDHDEILRGDDDVAARSLPDQHLHASVASAPADRAARIENHMSHLAGQSSSAGAVTGREKKDE